ncbi:MAG: hypothetical protein U5K70_00325 [Halodesulfurarchaeum sp.]|nr:hypothetical protein [Halodesulfurarchaeum sp.]
MFSSARRGQVEPLPALLALAVFAIGLSLYGATLEGVALNTGPEVSDATMDAAFGTLSEGPVVVPERLETRAADLPDGVAVILRADGRTWVRGNPPETAEKSRRRHVLVRTDSGEVPGTLRVEA